MCQAPFRVLTRSLREKCSYSPQAHNSGVVGRATDAWDSRAVGRKQGRQGDVALSHFKVRP